MTDDARPNESAPETPPARGFTLDLSGAGTRPRKKKGAPALVTRTINLSTPKPAPPPEPEAPEAKAPRPAAPTPTPTPRKGPGRDERARTPRREGGHSLADLLDPETLARLRGEG